MRKKLFCVTLLSLVSSPSIAQENDASAVPPPAEAEAKENASKVICKKQDVTGSFVKRRKVCRTAAEWNKIAQHSKTEANDYADHGRGGSRGN